MRRLLPAEHKRAFKLAAMRDCSRRCVYCGSLLEFDLATLDHVHPLAHGGAHVERTVAAARAALEAL